MYNITPQILSAYTLAAVCLLSKTSVAQPNGTDTLTTTVVTSEQWQQSTVIDYKTCESFPWTGIWDFPQDSTYTMFPVLDQPYGYVTISTVPGAPVIKSEDGVRFYRTYFNVDSLAAITQCRFRTYVDDDLAIYLNGVLVAQESSGNFNNYRGVSHDLVMYDFGPYANGYNGGDAFDYVNLNNANHYFTEGRNQLLVAVRNKKNDLGGFSFRMDFDYVIDPQWVGVAEQSELTETIEIYPNPTEDWVSISSEKEMNGASVVIYNAKGSRVYENEASKFPHHINLTSLPSGIYHLFVQNSHFTINRRLIRQ